MRRIFLIFTLFLFSLTMVACDPSDYFFDTHELQRKMAEISLINYDFPNINTVKGLEDIEPFDFEKVEFLEVMKSENHERFLNDLSKVHFHLSDKMTKFSNSPTGNSIMIRYKNGDILTICSSEFSNFVGEYDAEGNKKGLTARFVTSADFNKLVNSNFAFQVK
ncbi:hypothetical protein LJC17_03875 [Acholeplasma sp. OttesenSCG-928-E16]|nr:hypothetical protein [Acholeplasma sp. OttesenSCG-928-E16]